MYIITSVPQMLSLKNLVNKLNMPTQMSTVAVAVPLQVKNHHLGVGVANAHSSAF